MMEEPVRQMIALAGRHKIIAKIYPSASFVDGIIANMQLSIGHYGYAVMEATKMVESKIRIDPRVPLFIAQVGAYKQKQALGLSSREPSDYTTFVTFLRRFYPANHLIRICDTDPDTGGFVQCECPVSYFANCAPFLSYKTTLFVPAREDRS